MNMKLICLALIAGSLSFAQVGPQVTQTGPGTIFYTGFHYATDIIPEPYMGSFPNWFVVRPPVLASYYSPNGLANLPTTIDPHSISVIVNGVVLTSRVLGSSDAATYHVTPETKQAPDYSYFCGSNVVIIILDPAVYHPGDRIRVSFGYLQ